MIRLAAVLWCLAIPAQAEMHIAELHAGILACDDAACVGAAAELCMRIEPDGDTTTGMMSCTLQEAAVWDDLLNDAYRDARAFMEDRDAQDRPSSPEYAVRATRLQEAQRAWITFRDSNCRSEYAMWGAGTMRMLAAAGCHLQMTAARTFVLRGYRQMFP